MPFKITQEFVQQLLEQIAQLTKQVSDLTAEISELQQTIKELEEEKNRNSQNSSKPPSSGGYAKKPTGLHGRSRRKQGG